jgi:hypothetical protein
MPVIPNVHRRYDDNEEIHLEVQNGIHPHGPVHAGPDTPGPTTRAVAG